MRVSAASFDLITPKLWLAFQHNTITDRLAGLVLRPEPLNIPVWWPNSATDALIESWKGPQDEETGLLSAGCVPCAMWKCSTDFENQPCLHKPSRSHQSSSSLNPSPTKSNTALFCGSEKWGKHVDWGGANWIFLGFSRLRSCNCTLGWYQKIVFPQQNPASSGLWCRHWVFINHT